MKARDSIYNVGNDYPQYVILRGSTLRPTPGPSPEPKPTDPLNPLNLPPFTIRCKFMSGTTPTMGDRQTLVDADENVWDICKNSTDWSGLFIEAHLLEVLGANTSGVTNMSEMFGGCQKLAVVQPFDTSSCTNMYNMFAYCRSLTLVILFNTSSCTNMDGMFYACYLVQSGALALYQQASTQATPPSSHSNCFMACGLDSDTGMAELNQIPKSWGGTAE